MDIVTQLTPNALPYIVSVLSGVVAVQGILILWLVGRINKQAAELVLMEADLRKQYVRYALDRGSFWSGISSNTRRLDIIERTLGIEERDGGVQ